MGKATTEEINRLVLELNGFVSADIPEEELAVFYEIFEKICKRLDEAESALEEKIATNK